MALEFLLDEINVLTDELNSLRKSVMTLNYVRYALQTYRKLENALDELFSSRF